MISEARFGQWTAIGVPLFVIIGIIGGTAIHIGYGVSWAHLFVPVALFVALQVGSYTGAFWTGRWARQNSRFWPMALLSGLYLWGAGMIVMHYGVGWGILPSFGEPVRFSICMAFVTVIAWIVAIKLGYQSKAE